MSDIAADVKQVTVKPNQDITASTSREFREELLCAIHTGALDLVVDLENVNMIDSDGMGAFIAAHKEVSGVGGKFSVCNASKDIWQFFRIMRLTNHFTVTVA